MWARNVNFQCTKITETMKVTALCATCGRHTLLERVVWQFLQQDYPDKYLIIINNHPDSVLQLDPVLADKPVLLINTPDVKSLGEVYQRTLRFLPADTEVVTHMDDDDQYLHNHLSAGVAGLQRGFPMDKGAYKPQFSWYRSAYELSRQSNVMEPSIFVHRELLEKYGYRLNTKDPHWGWIIPIQADSNFYEDPAGESTFVYDWSAEYPVWKASGDPDNPANFDNIRRNQQDHGDGIITPRWSPELYQLLHRDCNAYWELRAIDAINSK